MYQKFFEIIQSTILITSFVLVMMMLIEYITVQSKGEWSKQFTKSKWLQVIFAALLGVLPGCLGTFVAVSLYSHRILNFAALVTVMIATSGDEAFVMFSLMPKIAVILTVSIFFIAIATGFLINIFNKNNSLMVLPVNYLNFHSKDNHCVCFDKQTLFAEYRNINIKRLMLISGGVIYLFLLGSGIIGPKNWNWERAIFFMVGILGLFIVVTVPNHFLTKHIWNHVIKKHMIRIFLWILGALVFIYFLDRYIDVESWIRHNYYFILLIAVAIGTIPESGPHIVFITLFLNGTIPFSILLANSIVQDGHGAIPLLAESRRSFFAMKAINVMVGLIIGIVLNIFGM